MLHADDAARHLGHRGSEESIEMPKLLEEEGYGALYIDLEGYPMDHHWGSDRKKSVKTKEGMDRKDSTKCQEAEDTYLFKKQPAFLLPVLTPAIPTLKD